MLVHDLRRHMGVNDAGVDVILDLIDQMHGLRRTLAELLLDGRERGGSAKREVSKGTALALPLPEGERAGARGSMYFNETPQRPSPDALLARRPRPFGERRRGEAMSDPSTDAFWGRPPGTLLAETQSRAAGLTAAEAAERLARVGPNAVAAGAAPWRLALKVAKRFANPLVLILIAASDLRRSPATSASFAIIVA